MPDHEELCYYVQESGRAVAQCRVFLVQLAKSIADSFKQRGDFVRTWVILQNPRQGGHLELHGTIPRWKDLKNWYLCFSVCLPHLLLFSLQQCLSVLIPQVLGERITLHQPRLAGWFSEKSKMVRFVSGK